MVALYRITGEYAWAYTHPPIVAGGYPMDVAPPAAHIAMEAVAPAPLGQILGATSTSPSTAPSIAQHLERTTGGPALDSPPETVADGKESL